MGSASGVPRGSPVEPARLVFDRPSVCDLTGHLQEPSVTDPVARRYIQLETPSGMPYAVIWAGEYALHVPRGKTGKVDVAMSTSRARLRGIASMPLFAKRGVRFGEYFVPSGWMGLTLLDADAHGVELAASLPASIEVAAPPRARLSCADLAGHPRHFDDETALPSPSKHPSVAARRTGKVAFGIVAGEPPVGTVALGEADPLFVFDRRGAQLGIMHYLDEGTLFGWIDAAETQPPRLTECAYAIRDVPRFPVTSAPRPWSCAAEVPLSVVDRGGLLEVGTLLPGAPFDAERSDRGTWQTMLSELAEGIPLVPLHIRDADMRRCTKTPASP